MYTHSITRGRCVAVVLAAFLLASCDAREPTASVRGDIPQPSAAVAASDNLIQNASLEVAGSGSTPANWTTSWWGLRAPSFQYPVTGRTGRGAAVSFSGWTFGEARWQHASVAVVAQQQYEFNIWYKSTAQTSVGAEYVRASDGRRSTVGVATLPSSGGAWLQYTTTLTVPAGMARVSVYQSINRAGALTVDDLAFGTNSPPPPPPPADPTLTFTASPAAVNAGQSSTLAWVATSASTCTASGAWSGERGTAGSLVVSPAATATYTLTCAGVSTAVTRSAIVTVSPAPPPPPPAGEFAEGLFSFTFDDSWESQYVNALPILQAAGVQATFYLTTNGIEQGWNLFMKPWQVQDLAAKGHEIGGHTLLHPDLTTLAAAAVITEISNSRSYLQTLTGQPVVSFAYPYGSSNASVRDLVRQAGYSSGRGVGVTEQNTANTDKYNLFSRCYDNSLPTSAILTQIDAAIANKQWYILCLHEIKLGGDNISMPPAQLQQIVDHVRQSGVRVVTVAQGRALMRP